MPQTGGRWPSPNGEAIITRLTEALADLAKVLALPAPCVDREFGPMGANLRSYGVHAPMAPKMPDRRRRGSGEVGVVGGAEAEAEVAEANEGRGDPSAEGAEVLVEQSAGAVGEGLLGELVQALVGDLDGVLGLVVGALEVADLDREPGSLQPLVADQRAGVGHRRLHDGRLRSGDQPLHAEDDLHLDRRLPIEHLVDTPTAICRLAPTRPVERDVGDDPRRLALARQAVRRLPRRSPSSTSTWKCSSNAWRSRNAASNASRSALIASVNTWSSISLRRYPAPRSAAARGRNEGARTNVRLMSLVVVTRSEGVATLTLNNPAERNTLTAPMVAEIIAAMDEIEADDDDRRDRGHRCSAGVLCGSQPRQPRRSRRDQPRLDLRRLPAHRPQPAADTGGGQRRGGRCRHEPGSRLRHPPRCPAGQVRHRFLQIGLHPGGGHTWMLRRIAGPQTAMAAVVFGEVMDGEEAARVGLAHRCVDDDQLLAAAQAMAARAASAPRDLAIEPKKTIQAMADIETHPHAVKRELDAATVEHSSAMVRRATGRVASEDQRQILSP